MMSSKLFLITGLLSMASAAGYAQSVGPATIDAAGASASAGGNTYEYAIGQIVAGNTFTSAAIVITPGVLQPAAATGIKANTIAAGNLQVFPSPAEHTVFIQPAFSAGGTLQWGLYTADGKLALSNTAVLSSGKEQQELDVTALAAGHYVLQVSWTQAGEQYTSGYKIQKLR